MTKEDVRYAVLHNRKQLYAGAWFRLAAVNKLLLITQLAPNPSKCKRLELDTVYNIIVDNKNHDDDALCLLAWQQK